MRPDIIDLAVVDVTSYHSPKRDAEEMTRRYTGAGVRVWLADQTLNWFPDGLWTPELAPIAAEWPRNAFWDVYPLATYLAARVPGSRFLFSLDTIRRGPDVLAQTLMTLQELCGDVQFAFGAGEIKQLAPFGYREEKPIARLRESLDVIQRLWSADAPIDYAGKTLSLRNAHLGTRAYDSKRPPLFVVGTGPKLMEIGAQLSDGIMIWMPHAQIPAQLASLRETARAAGRDADRLLFWGGNPVGMVMTYDTPEERERLRRSPVTRFIAAAWGRMSGAAWKAEGFESPLGPDWHYGKDLVPTEWSTARVRDVIDRVPDGMVDAGVLFWREEQLAEHFASAVRAGIGMPTWMDWGPFADPAQRWPALERTIRAARRAARMT